MSKFDLEKIKDRFRKNKWIIFLMMPILIVSIYFADQNGYFSKKTSNARLQNMIPLDLGIVVKKWNEPDLGIIDGDRDRYKKSYHEILNSKYDEKFKKNANLLNTYLEKTDDESKIDMLDQYFCKSDTKIENIILDDTNGQNIDDSHLMVIINSSEKLQKLKDSIIEVKCPEKK